MSILKLNATELEKLNTIIDVFSDSTVSKLNNEKEYNNIRAIFPKQSTDLEFKEVSKLYKKSSLELSGKSKTEKQPINEWLVWLRGDINQVYKNGVNINESFDSLPLIKLYEAQEKPIPPEIKVAYEEQEYDFYKVEVVYSNYADEFVKIKNVMFTLKVKDNSSNKDRQTRFIQMFPENTYKEILKSNVNAKIGLDAKGNVKVVIPAITLPVGHGEGEAGIYTKFDSSVDLELDDFVIKKALIQTTGLHHNKIIWHFDEIVPRDDFKVWVFLKVPKEVREVKLSAELEATFYKDEWWPLKDTKLNKVKDKHVQKIELLSSEK